ncbi:hypothetical protein ALI22I_01210 [Saccharothrix sp. ALI-22-I]|uniref:two-component regulator propeller domain-containing protein n=1 Tax=Saccharothrix sp. ALI-22-I TaxID=1933778 RepID=UPI00097BF43B|nr:two-component regulator propeller domain-containing protein [Saccharothrix sp. ALI-22-I]ONI92922.1 hypothetical protein ALI22I_01210 [Saccharothrix sp. ALI-22-I]
MRIGSFTASADLCGRRVALRWTIVPDSDETAPRVTVRRKRHDFDFPARLDSYLIYDSAAFPPTPRPGVLAVHDLPDATSVDGGLRVTEQTCTVGRIEGGRTVEIVRRTIRTVTDAVDRAVVRREVDLLDAGAGGGALDAGVTYYYQLDASSTDGNAVRLRASATPTAVYRYNRVLYDMLPNVYRRLDTAERPQDASTGLLPEAAAAGGQLRRLIDVFGTAVGALRSSADGLRGVRDTVETDCRFLPLLAQWIGWDLGDADIARQRGEITAAPRRYRTTGTLVGIRELVDHYTGWTARISEMAQHISLTNSPPQRNVFAAVETNAGFQGVDDAAVVLGLTGASVADLTGKAIEPFALRDGMSMRLAVDRAAPNRLHLRSTDFTDIGAASAAEVAAVIGRTVHGVDAAAVGGKVRLRSRRGTPQAHVEVFPATASLVSLDGAPGGRLATAVDPSGVGWLVYATPAGPDAADMQSMVKARLLEQWYDARPIGTDMADPAVATPAGGTLWCAWVSNAATARSRLRHQVGTVAAPTAAQLRGDAVAPFALVPGTRLVITGSIMAQTFTIRAGDYANVGSAMTGEVVAAMNAQLAGVTARSTGAGTIVLTSSATGPTVTMRVDLAASTAAWALGFGDRELIGRGGWTPDIDWKPACDVGQVPLGRHAQCTATADAGGGVRLCWSTHDGGRWRIATSRWADRILAATPSGLTVLAADGASSIAAADGLPTNDVRDAVADADGTIWFATAAGAAARTAGGVVMVFTTASTGGGLVSNDVRSVAVAPDGTVWFATQAGVSGRAADGEWTTFDVSSGLPAVNIRSVAATMEGTLWAATSAGVAVRWDNKWRAITVADGLPTGDTRRVVPAPDGAVWVATPAGAARIGGGKAVATTLSDLGPGANDVRALAAEGTTMWLATAAGAVELRASGVRVLHAAADGIADTDCRAVTVSDGTVWIGTASGLHRRDGTGRWTAVAGAPGAVVALTGSWSPPMLIGNPAAGERDPHILRDGTALLLTTSRRKRSAQSDTWQIILRRRDATAAAWTDETELTAAGAVDREPALTRGPGQPVRVYFRSDRGGGARVWHVEVNAAGAVTEPRAVTKGPSTDTDPAVLAMPDLPSLLLFRSDRNVAVAGLSTDPGRPPVETSVRRFAGSTTAVPADAARNNGRRGFGDLLDYTPQRPRGDPPAPDEHYTPGTVVLHLDRGRAEQPPEAAEVHRLRQLLADFVPATVRIVTIPDP